MWKGRVGNWYFTSAELHFGGINSCADGDGGGCIKDHLLLHNPEHQSWNPSTQVAAGNKQRPEHLAPRDLSPSSASGCVQARVLAHTHAHANTHTQIYNKNSLKFKVNR